MCGEAEGGHLFGVAEQLVEVNLGRSDEGAGAMAALDDAIAGQLGEGVACGHEADVVDAGELALGRDGVAGLELARVDAAADDVLNPAISRFVAAIWPSYWNFRCGRNL